MCCKHPDPYRCTIAGELYTTNDEVRYAARYPREERYGSIIYSCTLLFGWDDEGYGPTNFFWKELPDQPENSSTVSKWVESHYIDRITFRGGYAQFEYEAYDDTRTRILNPVLERIVIYDTQGVARQTIVFTQSNVDQRYERYLQSVQIGNDTYSFSYGMAAYRRCDRRLLGLWLPWTLFGRVGRRSLS